MVSVNLVISQNKTNKLKEIKMHEQSVSGHHRNWSIQYILYTDFYKRIGY